MKRQITFILICMLFIGITTSYAQNSNVSTSPPEARQFDFWIGTWKLSWPGGQAGTPEGKTGVAKNVITTVLDSSVIEENFSAAELGFNGRSLSVYNANKKKWQQTWVDNTGAYLLFEGEFKNGKMELLTKPFERNGKTFISRMVFKNIQHDNLDWDWQRSNDGGKSWQDVWNIHYTRQN